MSASEKLKTLDGAATISPWTFSDSTDRRGHKGEFRAPNPVNGFMLVGPWINGADGPSIATLRNALPQIVAVVAAAERAVPVIAQGERAMQEMVWTQRDVTARDALSESLAALEEALS